jgi:hypothetical protein
MSEDAVAGSNFYISKLEQAHIREEYGMSVPCNHKHDPCAAPQPSLCLSPISPNPLPADPLPEPNSAKNADTP